MWIYAFKLVNNTSSFLLQCYLRYYYCYYYIGKVGVITQKIVFPLTLVNAIVNCRLFECNFILSIAVLRTEIFLRCGMFKTLLLFRFC